MDRLKFLGQVRLRDQFIDGKEEPAMYSLHGRETIYLQELRPGMVLADPVLDRNGNRLLNSEITLDESKIAKLRERGIGQVRVQREVTLTKIAGPKRPAH